MDPPSTPPSLYDKLHAQLDAVLKREQPLEERVNSLMTGWTELANHCRAFPAEQVVPIALCFRDQTLTIILGGLWTQSREQYEILLERSIRRCGEELVSVAPKLSKHISQLLRVLENPWGNPILARILENPNTSIREDEYEFFMRESPYMILTRLKQLYNNRCEDLALNLVTALMECCDVAQCQPVENQFTMTLDQTLFTFDVYITLLVRAGRADFVGRELQNMDYDQGCDLVKRFSRKRADVSRLWRSAGKIALLAAAIFTSRAVLLPFEQCKESLADLVQVWLRHSDDNDGLEKLQQGWVKLIPGSISSQHVYTFCDAITPQFSDKLRYFKLQLLVRAISTDINMLEKLKTQSVWNTDERNGKTRDDVVSNMVKERDPEMSLLSQEEIEARILATNEFIAAAFVRMADWVSHSPQLLRECLLTAFSIRPTAEVLARIEDSAFAMGNRVIPSSTWTCSSHPPGEEGDDNLADEELLFVCPNCGNCSKPVDFDEALKCAAIHSYNIYEVVQEENPCIGPDVKDDVIVLLFAARYQPLSWNQRWPELHRLCSLFLRDTIRVRKITKKLDYASIDFVRLFEKKKLNVERERLERRALLEQQDEAFLQSLFQDESSDNGDNSDDHDWEEGPKRKKQKRMKPRKLRDSSSEDEDDTSPITDSSAPSTSYKVFNVPDVVMALNKNLPLPNPQSTKLLRTFRRNNYKAIPAAATTAQDLDSPQASVSFSFRDTYSLILGEEVANKIIAGDTNGHLDQADTSSKNGAHRSLNTSVRRTIQGLSHEPTGRQGMVTRSQTNKRKRSQLWTYEQEVLAYEPDIPPDDLDILSDDLLDIYQTQENLLNESSVLPLHNVDTNSPDAEDLLSNNVCTITPDDETLLLHLNESHSSSPVCIRRMEHALTEAEELALLADSDESREDLPPLFEPLITEILVDMETSMPIPCSEDPEEARKMQKQFMKDSNANINVDYSNSPSPKSVSSEEALINSLLEESITEQQGAGLMQALKLLEKSVSVLKVTEPIVNELCDDCDKQSVQLFAKFFIEMKLATIEELPEEIEEESLDLHNIPEPLQYKMAFVDQVSEEKDSEAHEAQISTVNSHIALEINNVPINEQLAEEMVEESQEMDDFHAPEITNLISTIQLPPKNRAVAHTMFLHKAKVIVPNIQQRRVVAIGKSFNKRGEIRTHLPSVITKNTVLLWYSKSVYPFSVLPFYPTFVKVDRIPVQRVNDILQTMRQRDVDFRINFDADPPQSKRQKTEIAAHKYNLRCRTLKMIKDKKGKPAEPAANPPNKKVDKIPLPPYRLRSEVVSDDNSDDSDHDDVDLYPDDNEILVINSSDDEEHIAGQFRDDSAKDIEFKNNPIKRREFFRENPFKNVPGMTAPTLWCHYEPTVYQNFKDRHLKEVSREMDRARQWELSCLMVTERPLVEPGLIRIRRLNLAQQVGGNGPNEGAAQLVKQEPGENLNPHGPIECTCAPCRFHRLDGIPNTPPNIELPAPAYRTRQPLIPNNNPHLRGIAQRTPRAPRAPRAPRPQQPQAPPRRRRRRFQFGRPQRVWKWPTLPADVIQGPPPH